MIVLDYRDSRPLYQQVKDSLRRMMLTGLLEPDEKLPSVRSLATQLAINPNTIQRAYRELEADGYILSVAGKGSFVAQIDQLAEQKIQAFGPYPTDEFFGNGHFVEFDGIMAMYHDQATTPFHSLYTEDGVLFTAGLPLVHTAANTTPSYSITGCNEADAISFRHAIYLALDAFCNREDYDEAYENPLPKLYHEKRDESEKVRFSIPKKKG